MNPSKVDRSSLHKLTDLPNIGQSMADNLQYIGIDKPEKLLGKCPYDMYDMLCVKTGARYDPCVIDVFISVTRFMEGEKAQPWWYYTDERKAAIENMC